MAKHWYIIHTYSGYEKRVQDEIKRRIESFGLQDHVFDTKVFSEEVTEVKEGGKQITREHNIYPGYVLVRMEVDDNSWSVVRNTPGVTGFVGIDGKPAPLTRAQFDKMMRRVGGATGGKGKPKRTETDFKEGQSIRVVSGPLADFDGTITEVAPESGKVKVSLTIFGRETPVELNLDQIVSA